MTKDMKRNLKAYRKSIRKQLPPLNQQQRKTLRAIFKETENYADDFPDATVADIQNEFGSPEIVAASILPAEEARRLKKQFRKNLCLAILAAVLAAALLFMSIILYDIYENKKII